jgi:hypothetical protein
MLVLFIEFMPLEVLTIFLTANCNQFITFNLHAALGTIATTA